MPRRPHPLDHDLMHALHEQALADAERLRREAIDDFWRGADQVLGGWASGARRSAERLARRLQRRAPHRAGAGGPLTGPRDRTA